MVNTDSEGNVLGIYTNNQKPTFTIRSNEELIFNKYVNCNPELINKFNEVSIDFKLYQGKRPIYASISVGYPSLDFMIDSADDRKSYFKHIDLLSQMLSKHMVWVDREKLIFQGAAAIAYLLETKYVATKQEAMMVLNAMLEERLFSSTTDVPQEMPPVPVATAESEMTNDGKIRPPKPPNMMSEGFHVSFI